MKITDVLVEKTQTPRPRNFVAKNAMKTTSGAGKHKDKKKAAKQGDVKHKGKMSESAGDAPDEQYLDKVIGDLHKDALGFRPDREFGQEWMSSSFEEKLEIYNNLLKSLHSDMDEGIGGMIAGGVGQFIGNKIDPLAGEILRAHGEIAGRKAEYTIRKYMHLLQKALKQQLDSGGKNDENMREASDFGEPQEILADVMQTLEREVEWPLTDVMDRSEVQRLLQPVRAAINAKMRTVRESQGDDWGSMSHREFKRKELQHELGHEDDPDFERKLREKDRGPWYIKIDGKIYKQKGEPKAFDWKKGANNYALAILKNRPELQGKIVLTKKPIDEMTETATASATSADNVEVGAVYKNKKGRTYKNPDGTAKNALDVKGANLLTGGSIAKR